MTAVIYFGVAFVAFVAFLVFYKKWLNKATMCPSSARLDGKTVIITGANTGIGKETARQLAKRGAKVIMACRDLPKAHKAAEEIKKDTENPYIIVRQLDLSSKQSICTFSDLIKRTENKIDILIHNAGVGNIPYTRTEDGFETTMMVNYLGPFLLTYQLLELLLKSSPSRVINVSAHAHVFCSLNLDDLMMEHDYGPIRAYCRSKMAQILYTRELARRLEDTRVTAYSLHPGVVYTELLRHSMWNRIPVISPLLHRLAGFLLKNVEEGCQTTLYCAVADELEHERGLYYSNCAVSTPLMEAVCVDKAYRLWMLSEELLGLDPSTDWAGPRHLGMRTDDLEEEDEVLLEDLCDIEEEEEELVEEGFEYID